jgi:hypothetical protein
MPTRQVCVSERTKHRLALWRGVKGRIGAGQLAMRQVIGVLLVEHVITYTQQSLPLWRQFDHVLHVKAGGVLGVSALGGLPVGLERHVDQGIAVHRHPGHIGLVEYGKCVVAIQIVVVVTTGIAQAESVVDPVVDKSRGLSFPLLFSDRNLGNPVIECP